MQNLDHRTSIFFPKFEILGLTATSKVATSALNCTTSTNGFCGQIHAILAAIVTNNVSYARVFVMHS